MPKVTDTLSGRASVHPHLTHPSSLPTITCVPVRIWQIHLPKALPPSIHFSPPQQTEREVASDTTDSAIKHSFSAQHFQASLTRQMSRINNGRAGGDLSSLGVQPRFVHEEGTEARRGEGFPDIPERVTARRRVGWKPVCSSSQRSLCLSPSLPRQPHTPEAVDMLTAFGLASADSNNNNNKINSGSV